MTPLLSLNISVRYGQKPILDRVSLDIQEGEAVGVVGQSGAGKSTLALAILGLTGWKGGEISGSLRFRSRELIGLKERELRSLRGKEIGLVLQSASSALNPALRLETQFREAWEAHSPISWLDQRREALCTLSRFGLPCSDEFLRRFPGGISVGQAQRVLIAMAMLHSPALLVADEPTSALDPLTAREVLESLRVANQECNTALVYITHNLATVPNLCHRVAVMRDGQIVEQNRCAELFAHPKHQYTQSLLQAVLRPVAHLAPLIRTPRTFCQEERETLEPRIALP